jgi:hypothetical protein
MVIRPRISPPLPPPLPPDAGRLGLLNSAKVYFLFVKEARRQAAALSMVMVYGESGVKSAPVARGQVRRV